MKSKKHGTGLQIRCLKCDFTEPWNKSVALPKGTGRKFMFGRCPNCKRIRLRVIENVPDPRIPKP
jgi:hypothetical protein